MIHRLFGYRTSFINHCVCAVLCVLTFISPLSASSQPESPGELTKVRVVSLDDPQAESLKYFEHLIVLALDATTEQWGPYELVHVPFNYSQERSLKLLDDPDGLHVMHTMQSKELDAHFIKVSIPLLDGLLGKRALLISAKNRGEFSTISQKQLRKKVACQGLHWADSNILEYNGFNVYRGDDFESMHKMLAQGRCDYFPRGLNEVEKEWQQYNGKYGELAIVDNLLLQYPAPVYFYLGKRNARLALRIEQGLQKIGGENKISVLLHQSEDTKASYRFLENPALRVLRLIRP